MINLVDRLRAPTDTSDVAAVTQLKEAASASADEIERLRIALASIANPIAHMQANLREGDILNGHAAVALSKDPGYLQGLARNALAAGSSKCGGEDD